MGFFTRSWDKEHERLTKLGKDALERGDHDAAEKAFLAAADVARQGPAKTPQRTILLAQSLTRLGDLYRLWMRYGEARSAYREAFDLEDEELGPHHVYTLQALVHVAEISELAGDLDQAERFYERALSNTAKEFGPNHPKVANVSARLGDCLRQKGELEKAESFYLKAVQIDQAHFGAENPGLVRYYKSLLLVYLAQNNAAQIEEVCPRIDKLTTTQQSEETGEAVATAELLAHAYERIGKLDKAEELYLRALSRPQAGSPTLIPALQHLARMYENSEATSKAEAIYAKLADLLAASPRRLALLGAIQADWGYLKWRQEKWEEAEEMYRQALATTERSLGRQHPRLLVPLRALAELCTRSRRDAEALELAQRGMQLARNAFGERSQDFLNFLELVGIAQFQGGQLLEAEQTHNAQLRRMLEEGGTRNLRGAECLMRLAQMRLQLGKVDAARKGLEDVIRILQTNHPNHPAIAEAQRQLGALVSAAMKNSTPEPAKPHR